MSYRFVPVATLMLLVAASLGQAIRPAVAGQPPKHATPPVTAASTVEREQIARAKKEIAALNLQMAKVAEAEGQRAAILRFYTEDFVSVLPQPIRTKTGFGTRDIVKTRKQYLKEAAPKGEEKLLHEGDNNFSRDLPVAPKNQSWRPDRYVFKGDEIQLTQSPVIKSEQKGFGHTEAEREKFRDVKNMSTQRLTYVRTPDGLRLRKFELLGTKTLVDGRPDTDFNDPIEDSIVKGDAH